MSGVMENGHKEGDTIVARARGRPHENMRKKDLASECAKKSEGARCVKRSQKAKARLDAGKGVDTYLTANMHMMGKEKDITSWGTRRENKERMTIRWSSTGGEKLGLVAEGARVGARVGEVE